eukprot:SAG31_NODE_46012_length_256_cov_0.662420_1_plen_84_part_11
MGSEREHAGKPCALLRMNADLVASVFGSQRSARKATGPYSIAHCVASHPLTNDGGRVEKIVFPEIQEPSTTLSQSEPQANTNKV